jgi:hypothetical protein
MAREFFSAQFGVRPQQAMMKRQLAVNLFLSFLAGALVWALSPLLTGHREPWDAEGFYYPASLLLAGLLLGLIRPHQFWTHYPGILLGQLTYMITFLPSGPLVIISIAFLAAYSMISLAGAAGSLGIRKLLN